LTGQKLMNQLVEDFLQYSVRARQAGAHTETYSALLNKFVAWAAKQGLSDWKSVELPTLMAFLQQRREQVLPTSPKSLRAASAGDLY